MIEGRSKGRNKAIEALKVRLAWDGVVKPKFELKNGIISVTTSHNGVYTIEESL